MLGSNSNADLNMRLAHEISKETAFDKADNRLYFFVREGFSNTRLSEGFCEKLKITSEMLNGEVIIDGWMKFDLSIGESFEMETGDEFGLTGIKMKA